MLASSYWRDGEDHLDLERDWNATSTLTEKTTNDDGYLQLKRDGDDQLHLKRDGEEHLNLKRDGDGYRQVTRDWDGRLQP